MDTYSQRTGLAADFSVHYQFLTFAEGGRASAPQQHIRFDFLYDGDDPAKDGLWMIWPEFVSDCGDVLPEGEVPSRGAADMFIVNRELVPHHMGRLAIGAKGYFMEGPKKVASCEVVRIGRGGLMRSNNSLERSRDR